MAQRALAIRGPLAKNVRVDRVDQLDADEQGRLPMGQYASRSTKLKGGFGEILIADLVCDSRRFEETVLHGDTRRQRIRLRKQRCVQA
jgi:hypothetical protein